MEKIVTLIELRNSIALLKMAKEVEEVAIRKQLTESMQMLKPVNLIRHTVKELSVTPDFKGDLINASLSLGAGYLAKKIVIGNTSNPIKLLFGALLQIAVTKTVSKNNEEIKTVISGVIHNLLSK